MGRKNKYFCVFLAEMALLFSLSACIVNGTSADADSQKANDSTEREPGSANPPPEADSAEKYKAILLGEEDFVRIDYSGIDKNLNIENIKEVVSDEDWVTAKVTKFTVIDLDGDSDNEIVLWIQANENLDYGFEVLYFREQEVYGFTLPYRGLMDLKTDGTFDTAGGIEDSEDYYGTGRLRLSESGYTIEAAADSASQASKTDVGWYDLTPENVELAFKNTF